MPELQVGVALALLLRKLAQEALHFGDGALGEIKLLGGIRHSLQQSLDNIRLIQLLVVALSKVLVLE